MKKILIVVESGNKTDAIKKYLDELQKEGKLSKDDKYELDASVGHILELPKSWMPKNDESAWDPEKKAIRGKAKIINGLKAKAKKADLVYVATDPDREGEAIANDLVNKLDISSKYKRMIFNEITKDSIFESIQDLTDIDNNLVMAQKARLLLDRMMGYKLSDWIKRKIWNANPRSAGRVQSPTLKLVVEREVAIDAFKPEKYIKINQIINDHLMAPIILDKHKIDDKTNQLDPNHLDEVKNSLTGTLVVEKVKTSKRNGSKKIPFKQSAVYRAASSFYGMSAAASRAAMQALFERGFISYPRTDSTRYSTTFIKKTQGYIVSKFGNEYVATDIKGQAKGKQDAHEALRITDASNTPAFIQGKLKNQSEINMYKLIYNHTLQTLMTAPINEILSYSLIDGGYKFKLSSSKTIFKGYNILKSENDKYIELPSLNVGDQLESKEIEYIEGFTNPPPRFNEGSLIEAMETAGIGRPSTFSTTVTTLLKRGYVEKNGNALIATRLGKVVALSLMVFFENIIKENYTMSLEEILDKIAIGEKDYKHTLNVFWTRLQEELNKAYIKYKDTTNDKTQLINLSTSDIKQVNKEPNNYGAYDKEYMDLLSKFISYIKVIKKTIKIDWDKFSSDAKEEFIGPIIMPTPPKRGGYIIVDNNMELFYKNKDYHNVDICPICKKNPLIYRGTIRRGRLSWFKTCSGFPKVKCNHIENIDNQTQERLEAFYQENVEKFKSIDREKIMEYTQSLNLSAKEIELTQTILLNELNK